MLLQKYAGSIVVDWYPWIKAFHIVAMTAWMAALFYMPRLFVYHSAVDVGSESSELFKTMERRLCAAIMRPASIAVLISGGLLLWSSGFSLTSTWLIGKLIAVILMFWFHGFLEKVVVEFGYDIRIRDARFYRIINEVPTVLLITIVIFVVVKPFE
jgi:protoporphyrinogen IX oxidase